MKLFSLIAAFLLTAQLAAPAALAQTPSPAMGNLTAPNLATPAVTTAAATPPTAASTPIPVDAGAAFALGISAYESGNFGQARAIFAAAEQHGVSAALEYNFGNACFETKDYGGAVLHYLRALALNPRDPDTRQNLALARQAAGISVPDPTALERFSSWLSVDGWTWTAAIAGWAMIYLALLPRLFRWRGLAPWLLCAASLGVTIAAGVALSGWHQHAQDGVVLRADTPLKLAPTENSQVIGVVQSGEIGQAQEQYHDYFYTRTADGRLGWIAAANFATVWK
jgi:tetratricopeptide (TPR) repeat protein